MKRWQHFDYAERDEVATIMFSRPDRLNSLTFDVYADIRDLTDSLRRRQDIRVLVLRGQGRGFCSGADMAMEVPDEIHMGPGSESLLDGGPGMWVLSAMRQPVIASVLENEVIVTVRSAIPGSVAGLICSAPSNRLYS